MDKFTAGQEVILRQSDRRGPAASETVTIARVGRKYAFVVQFGREVAYRVEDGVEAGQGNNPGRIGTVADFEALDAWMVALGRLEELTRSYSWQRVLSTQDLTHVADLIDAANAKTP